jgi:hypothetical protein
VFSLRETKVLEVIEKKFVLSIRELTEYVYRGKKKPLNPSNGVGAAIRMINKKCKFHKLKWHLEGDGTGRQGRSVWLARRK